MADGFAVIYLTGGLAAGKSAVAERLREDRLTRQKSEKSVLVLIHWKHGLVA